MTSMVRHSPPLTAPEQQTAARGRLRIRLGTRASALATSQAGWVAEQIRAAGHEVTMVPVSTEGDRSRASLREIGGTGVFAAALRSALLEESIDIAVHSLKDLPVAPLDGLVIAAIPPREDPRDALVSAGDVLLADLPAGAVVGTGSPRRAAQLSLIAPQLTVRDIRGNVDSRLRMVTDGDLDAVVLAYAGLSRLGLTDRITEVLDLDRMLPAPGQGALAVECRSGDTAIREALAFLDHAETRRCVDAERLLLAALEAGCTAPVGAAARLLTSADAGGTTETGVIELTAFAALEDRNDRRTVTGDSDRRLTEHLAALFLNPVPPVDGSIATSQAPPQSAMSSGAHCDRRNSAPDESGLPQLEREM